VPSLFSKPPSIAPQGPPIVAMADSRSSSGGSTAGGSSANTTPERETRTNKKKAPTSNPTPKSDPTFDPPPGEEKETKEDGDETKKLPFGGKGKLKLSPPKFVSVSLSRITPCQKLTTSRTIQKSWDSRA
jgi:hypothetical protein